MKKKTPLFFLSFILLTANYMFAQNRPVQACLDSLVKKSADSVIIEFKQQNFSLVNSASITMESDYESAIIVDLKKGNWYVLAFVASTTSKIFQVTMFDSQQSRVAYEKLKASDKAGNVLVFNYRPEESGPHLINPLQSNKKNKMVCGQMMLFVKDRTSVNSP